MSYLVFCSFEVGGFPFRMADILNRYGFETYYVYVGPESFGHDSTQFHYGNREEPWYLATQFQPIFNNPTEVVRRLRQIKAEYHISHCLATGTDAYYLKLAGIRYHYWSFGSDLDSNCFIRASFKNRWKMLRFFRHPLRVYAERQRARDSIRYSDSTMVSPYQFRALRGIFPQKDLFFLPHCFRSPDEPRLSKEKEANKKSICKEIHADRYFFSSVRHCWTGDWKRMTDYKGNEVILNSYAKYLSLATDDHSKLILVKKGPDVRASKYLSRRLGIENRIIWVDEMKRDELDKYYQGADLCFGHFGTPVLTNAVLEALKNGTVGISYLIEHVANLPFYAEDPPIFNSRSPEEIANFMIKILNDQGRLSQQSFQSWFWVKKNCSEERFVESFLNLFNGSS